MWCAICATRHDQKIGSKDLRWPKADECTCTEPYGTLWNHMEPLWPDLVKWRSIKDRGTPCSCLPMNGCLGKNLRHVQSWQLWFELNFTPKKQSIAPKRNTENPYGSSLGLLSSLLSQTILEGFVNDDYLCMNLMQAVFYFLLIVLITTKSCAKAPKNNDSGTWKTAIPRF